MPVPDSTPAEQAVVVVDGDTHYRLTFAEFRARYGNALLYPTTVGTPTDTALIEAVEGYRAETDRPPNRAERRRRARLAKKGVIEL